MCGKNEQPFWSPEVHPSPVGNRIWAVVGRALLRSVPFGLLQETNDLFTMVLEPFCFESREVLCPQVEEPPQIESVVEIDPVPLVQAICGFLLQCLVLLWGEGITDHSQ